jgi:hypothetical protein
MKSPRKNKIKRFEAPTLDEVIAYWEENKFPSVEFQPRQFHAYYESNGWKVGKNPMRNWRMAASGWAYRVMERQGLQPIVARRKDILSNADAERLKNPPEPSKEQMLDAHKRELERTEFLIADWGSRQETEQVKQVLTVLRKNLADVKKRIADAE